MNILPGILESSFEAIQSAVASVASSVKHVHLDVCDGLFVSSKTWPYSHMKTGRIEENIYIKKLQQEDIGLPLWEGVEYQFDLMIKDPWRTIPVWAQIGATSVVIHPTSCDSAEKVLESVRTAQGLFMDVFISFTYDEWMTAKEKDLVGLTDLLTIENIKGLQCMTIKQIGLQGQNFDARWKDELVYIRETFKDVYIQLDGGVDEDVVNKVDVSYVGGLVIGSGIFKEGNADEHVNFYQQMFS